MNAPAVKPSEPKASAMQSPIRRKVLVQVAAVVAALWVAAFVLWPYAGPWPAVGMGVLTLVLVGAGVYVWRLTKRSSRVALLVQDALDPSRRDDALKQLEAGGMKGDVLADVARAQVVAQSKPLEAIEILEGIDIKKAPLLVQDDIRANLIMLYLLTNKTQQARALAEAMKPGRQGQPEAKAMSAAVSAEAFARTGSPAEAERILGPFNPEDPSYGQAGPLLLRARVFCDLANSNRKRAASNLEKLAKLQPQMVMGFLQKGTRPELQQMARRIVQRQRLMPQAPRSLRGARRA